MLMRANTLLLLIFANLIFASGCDRKTGRTIDVEQFSENGFDFMVIRNKISLYDEFTNRFWCRSIQSLGAPRTEYSGQMEPPMHLNEGWRYMGGYGGRLENISKDIPRNHLKVISDQVAYVDKGDMAITLDACRTRTYFLFSEGARFSTQIIADDVRYPGSPRGKLPYQVEVPFLRDFKVHEGGGCFEINPEYVDERKQYFYCSSNLGKTWTLETERKQTPPPAPLPAIDKNTPLTKPS